MSDLVVHQSRHNHKYPDAAADYAMSYLVLLTELGWAFNRGIHGGAFREGSLWLRGLR